MASSVYDVRQSAKVHDMISHELARCLSAFFCSSGYERFFAHSPHVPKASILQLETSNYPKSSVANMFIRSMAAALLSFSKPDPPNVTRGVQIVALVRATPNKIYI